MDRNLRESLAVGRNFRASSLNKSFNGLYRDSEENLDLFSKNRRSLPSPSSADSQDVPMKLGRLSLGALKLPSSGGDDLLASTDGGKHDYDWLLTPPGTPLGSESRLAVAVPRNGSSGRSNPTPKTSRLSVSQSESNRSARPARSNSVTRSSTVSASKYSGYSSNRYSSVLNTSSTSVTSYTRPSSPISRSPSTARPSSPSRPTISRPSTPSKNRPASTSSSFERTRPLSNSRPSTPSSRPQISASSRSSSRPSTPTSRSAGSGFGPSVSAVSAGRINSNGRCAPGPSSRPSSPGPRVRSTQQPIIPPDFPLETPPNLRTTLPDRPISAGRSRPTMRGSPEPTGSTAMPRRNPSPIVTRGRLVEPIGRGRVNANGHGFATDGVESRRMSNVLDSGRRTPKSSSANSESNGFGRNMSKSSLDMALRHMDLKNGKSSNRQLSNTTLFPQSVRSATSRIQSVRGLNRSETMNSSSGSQQSGEMSESGSVLIKPVENGKESNEGRYLAKLTNIDMFESTRYDTLLLKEDVKNTNWLHSIDDKSDQGLIFDNGFLPEPFAPL